jgi:NADH:ubiquinone oxidoreductase subunit 4 (subunit M)
LLDVLHDAAPRLVVLLVLSPALGAWLTAWAGRHGMPAARHAALVNSGLTAALGLLVAIAFHTLPSGPNLPPPAFSATIPWFQLAPRPAVSPTVTEPPPPAMSVALSFGVDRLNVGPLTWLPWLMLGALFTIESPPRMLPVLWLLLETTLLATFAAADAVTFGLSLGLTTATAWGLIGGWGEADRRRVAGGFARVQLSALVWWTLSLFGMAVSAAWCRQEYFTHLPAIDFRWPTLTRLLPDVVQQSAAALWIWDTATPLLFTLAVLGTVLRGPFVPLHTPLLAAVRSSLPATAVVLLATWPVLTCYPWMSCFGPSFAHSISAASPWMTLWASATVLSSAVLGWRTPDLRTFAVMWTLSLQALAWLAILATGPTGQTAGWRLMQAAALGGAAWMLFAEGATRRQPTGTLRRWPRWTTAMLLLLGPLVLLPALAFGPGDPQTTGVLLLIYPVAAAGGALGWFLMSWAALRRLLRLLRSTTTTPTETETPDLTWPEMCLLAILAAGLLTAACGPELLSPEPWRGQP